MQESVPLSMPLAVRSRPPLWLRLLPLWLVLLLAVGTVWWWVDSGRVESARAELDGMVLSVAPSYSARVLEVSVRPGQEVRQGALLARLDAADYNRRLGQAAREADDLRRMENLPGNLYNFHPGAHMGRGVQEGARLVADTLNAVVDPQQSTIVLLETMTGKGTELGGRFEELAAVLERVHAADRIGVCLDTCHVYDAGYDIVNDLDGVLDEFDRVVGLNRLYAVHLNDSKNSLGSRRDRHEIIGKGTIGFDALVRVLTHPKLACLPFILETPTDLNGYGEEIRQLREAIHSV